MAREASIAGQFSVRFAKIDTASSGATAIVSAVAGYAIRVVAFFCVAGADVTVKWQSNSTDLTGAMSLAEHGGISADSHSGLFETALGAALNITLGGAVQVSGSVAYVLVPHKVKVSSGDLV